MSDDRVGGDSEMRRRAAWLFGMLVLVAILIVTVMSTLLGTDKGGNNNNGEAVGPNVITSTGPGPVHPSGPARTLAQGGGKTRGVGQTSSAPSIPGAGSTATTATSGPTTCPTAQPCALDTDIANAVAYINAYRVQHGLAAVPGSVSAAAQACALNRGNGCKGGWAETEVPAPADGKLAVTKISQFAQFTDSHLTAIEVGWAYDPGSKTYYFATIRDD